jgi:hypothetical protein
LALRPKRAWPIKRLQRLLCGWVLLLAVAGSWTGPVLAMAGCGDPPAEPCSRILFMGNSYTYVNDLPHMYAELARSGGHPVEVAMLAEADWGLSDHAGSGRTLETLASAKWDYVILQDQSQWPAIEQYRTERMVPAARRIVGQIEAAGARPIFFLTWAHRQGWPRMGLADYDAMQDRINQGYLAISREMGAPVAPVGFAWQMAVRQNPPSALWQADGIHPSPDGTYLAACVFYATTFRESPEGLHHSPGIPRERAVALQTIAAVVVLENEAQWNLP